MKKLLLWLCIPLLAWYVSDNWYQLMLIQGDSMLPAYHHLQLVVLNKHDRDFQRGDVAAFRCDTLDSVLVKRIAAVPGDNAFIYNETLYINDQISEIPEESENFSYAGILEEKVVLQPGEYLMLGDNVEQSKDSRYPEVGLIDESQIYGKIGFCH